MRVIFSEEASIIAISSSELVVCISALLGGVHKAFLFGTCKLLYLDVSTNSTPSDGYKFKIDGTAVLKVTLNARQKVDTKRQLFFSDLALLFRKNIHTITPSSTSLSL